MDRLGILCHCTLIETFVLIRMIDLIDEQNKYHYFIPIFAGQNLNFKNLNLCKKYFVFKDYRTQIFRFGIGFWVTNQTFTRTWTNLLFLVNLVLVKKLFSIVFKVESPDHMQTNCSVKSQAIFLKMIFLIIYLLNIFSLANCKQKFWR